jgi:hypothetical protein
MKRRIFMFTQNVDALVPLILGVAVSALGLLDFATPHVVDNSILIVLAVLSFALLRDRWNKDSIERGAKEVSAETLSVMRTLQATTAPLAELDQLVARMHVTVEGLATVKTLRRADIDRAFVEARRHTDRWSFKGGTGTYTRAVTLPRCVENARRERRPLQVRLEILDPTDEALCEKYTRYRTSLSSGPDGTGEPWTLDRTRKESFATVLAVYWYQQRFQLLDLSFGLTSTMSTFRFDLSATRIIITQDNSEFPAMMILSDSPLYDGYATELRTSLSQARRVPFEEVRVLLDEVPAEAQVREFFAAVKLPLPEFYSDEDVCQVIEKAIRAKNPYADPAAV